MRIVMNDGVMREIGARHVLIPISSDYARKGIFFEVNDTGKFIWECIEKAGDIELDSLYKKICDKCGVHQETIEADVDSFVDELRKRNLIGVLE